jgi:hypothetical protein
MRTEKLALLSLCMICVITVPALVINPQTASGQVSGAYNKHFVWDYKDQHWTWNLSIPVILYYAYKAIPVSTRTQYGPAGYGFCTTTNDSYVRALAKQLNDTANRQGYNTFDKLSFMLAFVQSLPYTSDSVTTGHDEYPRFPVETLVDDGGDCEDTSILFATLTIILGYKTVYINPEGHYAVGIEGSNLRGTYWTYPEDSKDTYYYCETTGSGFMIGEMPYQHIGKTVNIYPIDQSRQFVFPNSILQELTETSSTPDSTQSSTPQPTVSQPSGESNWPEITVGMFIDNMLLYVLLVFAFVFSLGFVLNRKRSKNRVGSS